MTATALASWVDEPFLSLDTETTGIDCWSDRIVEIAAVVVHPDGTTGETYTTIVNPGVEIPEGAAAIHGITTARAVAEGVTPAEALAEVARRIFDHGHRPVVGFNMRFDWPILVAEAERHGVEFPFLAPVLDPFLVDKMVDRFRRGTRKLVAVAQHYAVELDEAEAHGALADAVAAARVMRALIDRYPQIGRHSLASVFLRQVRGYEQWRTGFVEFKRRTDSAFDIAPGWPLPSDGVPVIKDATEQGAGVDGPDSGGDASTAGDGADSHDVGRTEPEPAPALLPDADPPAPGDDTGVGEPADGSVTATGEPTPAPTFSKADIAKVAGRVFKADYDAAPRGQKAKVLDRLRHAFTYACTGRVFSLDDCTPAELAAVYGRLHFLEEGSMGYEVADNGVTFTVKGGTSRAFVAWETLTSLGDAA